MEAIVKGPDGDGNPNYATVQSCAALCSRHGLSLVKAAPCFGLDLREASGERQTGRYAKVFEHYDRTIELVAEKEREAIVGRAAGKLERVRSLAYAVINRVVAFLRRWLK